MSIEVFLNLYRKLNDKDKLKIQGMMELKIYEYKNNIIYISDYKNKVN